MITLTSHVLDAVRGDHAAGLRVSARRVGDGSSGEPLFERHTDADGRIRVEIAVTPERWPLRVELRFHVAEYFASAGSSDATAHRLDLALFRLCIGESDTVCHVPLVLAPHSCTVWCSATA